MVADHSRGKLDAVGIQPSEHGIGLRSQHKETAELMLSVQACEFKVGSVHDIHIMQFSVGDMDECWDIAVQIQQGMEFDSRFGFANPAHGNNDKHGSMVEEFNT